MTKEAKKNITIRFEDRFVLERTFYDFNRDNNCKLSIDEFTRFIRLQLSEALERLQTICPSSLEYEVNVINRAPSNIKSSTIAYFDHRKSTDSKHYFCYYLDYGLPHYYRHCALAGHSDAEESNVWLHELVHSADFTLIKHNIKRLKFFDIENEATTLSWTNPEDDKQMMRILSWLMRFRDEGLATFIEELFDSSKPDMEQWNMLRLSAPSLFSAAVFRPRSVENEALAQLPYVLGKYLIFNCMYHIDEDNRHIYNKIACKINATGINDVKLSDFEGVDILPKLLSITLEEFIFTTLLKQPLGLNYAFAGNFINAIKQFLWSCRYRETNYSTTLLRNAINGQANTAEDFIEVLGYPLSREETEEAYNSFDLKSVNLTMRKLLVRTYEQWRETGDEIAAWKLTYVFDDEDIVNDEIPILGYLDDMLVLH